MNYLIHQNGRHTTFKVSKNDDMKLATTISFRVFLLDENVLFLRKKSNPLKMIWMAVLTVVRFWFLLVWLAAVTSLISFSIFNKKQETHSASKNQTPNLSFVFLSWKTKAFLTQLWISSLFFLIHLNKSKSSDFLFTDLSNKIDRIVS